MQRARGGAPAIGATCSEVLQRLVQRARGGEQAGLGEFVRRQLCCMPHCVLLQRPDACLQGKGFRRRSARVNRGHAATGLDLECGSILHGHFRCMSLGLSMQLYADVQS